MLKHGTLTHRLHRSGRVPEGAASAYTTARATTAQNLGLEIVGHMRQRMDDADREIPAQLLAASLPRQRVCPAGSSRMDREKYGMIRRRYGPRILHELLPCAGLLSDLARLRRFACEAPYHALTNGGHISYIELDGDPTQNLEAFEKVVRCMKERGIGYGAINHPIDRDPVCGYTGIIGEVCPRCGRREGEGVPLSKLQKLGLYKNYNSTTIGYHGDPAEEADRQPNTLKIVKK